MAGPLLVLRDLSACCRGERDREKGRGQMRVMRVLVAGDDPGAGESANRPAGPQTFHGCVLAASYDGWAG